MKKAITLLISLLFFSVILFDFSTVKAYQDGDYFIEDFSDYSNGDTSISSSVNGTEWLTGERVVSASIQSNRLEAVDSALWNFTFMQPTTNFSFTHAITVGVASIGFATTIFYTSNGEQLMRLKTWNELGSDGVVINYVYDRDDVLKISYEDSSPEPSVNLNFNNGTVTWYESSGKKFNFDLPNLNYVNYWTCSFTETFFSGSAKKGIWDNINVLSIEGGGVDWFLDEESYGNVQLDWDSTTVISFIAIDYVTVEIERNINRDLWIKQVALALDDTTDIADLDIKLRLENQPPVSYTSVFTVDDHFVVVWFDLNFNTTVGEPFLEFLVIDESGNPQITLLNVGSDIDGDEDTEYKYSLDGTHANGVYDGVITDTDNDFVYQVWYEGIEPDFGNLTGYVAKGDIESDEIYTFSNRKYLESRFNLPVTQQIKAVDLMVQRQQYIFYPDFSEYEMQLNGVDKGNPSYWLPYDANRMLLRWYFTVDQQLTDEVPVFEFYHKEKLTDIFRWHIMESAEDVNNDGEIGRLTTDNDWMYDGLYDANFGHANDMIYRYWYKDQIIIEDEYNDFIDVSVESEPIFIFDEVIVFGTIAEFDFITTVRRHYWDGASWTEHTLEGNWIEYSPTFEHWFTIPFAFDNSGNENWNFTLFRNGATVAEKKITVETTTTEDQNYAIKTIPIPSYTGSTVQVWYIFNNSEHSTGKLVVSTSPVFAETGSYITEMPIVTKTNFSYAGSTAFDGTEGIKYIFMAIEISSNVWYQVGDTKRHPVKNQDYENWIDVVGITHYVGDIVLIDFQHNHLGNPAIAIFVNDYRIGGDISTVVRGIVQYTAVDSGHHTAQLVLLKSAGGFEVLKRDNFTVSAGELPEEQGVLPDVGTEIGALLGLIITISLMLLPIVILGSLKVDGDNIVVISALFGCMGIVISIYLGFFDLWVVFFIIIVIIAVLILQYMRSRGG